MLDLRPEPEDERCDADGSDLKLTRGPGAKRKGQNEYAQRGGPTEIRQPEKQKMSRTNACSQSAERQQERLAHKDLVRGQYKLLVTGWRAVFS